MRSKRLSVLVFSRFFLPGFKGGGPIKTVRNLFEGTGDELSFRLVTSDRDLGDKQPYTAVSRGKWIRCGLADVFYVSPRLYGCWQALRILLVGSDNIIYLNSFFSMRFSVLPLIVAKLLAKGVVLGPRGEFSAGALKQKRVKKKLFIAVYKFLGFHKGTVFQGSSIYEAEDIVRVLGRGVDVQIAEDIGGQQFALNTPVRSEKTLNVVFVSRISPMKNILFALEALRRVKESVKYSIYGPVEDRHYWSQCEAVIATLPPHIHVHYCGLLQSECVVNTMSSYDLFFMPSEGENYGHAIAEALCAGLPVLISDTTPWRHLQQQGVGWDLPNENPADFSAVLDQLAIMPAQEHYEMRQRVLAWAKDKFSQRDAIDANLAMFRYAYKKNSGDLSQC